MASAFGHSLVALTFTKAGHWKNMPKRLWFFSVLSSILPDFDSLGFRFGVPYTSVFGHRGFTHSMAFAGFWSFGITWLYFRKLSEKSRVFWILFMTTLSHGVLDAMTNGGLGVGFFIPFDNRRYFLPWRPIEVSPIRVSRFFDQAQSILVNEWFYIGLPCLCFLLIWISAQRVLKK